MKIIFVGKDGVKKSIRKNIAVTLLTVSLSACAASWVKLDGSSASDIEISRGKKKCQIDEKLYAFNERKHVMKYALFSAKSSEEAKKSWSDYLKDEKSKMQREIEECMKSEGLRKAR